MLRLRDRCLSKKAYSVVFTLKILLKLELDHYTGFDSMSPPVAAMLTGATYYAPSGLRVAALGGALGFGAVSATYAGYFATNKPYGKYGFLWF